MISTDANGVYEPMSKKKAKSAFTILEKSLPEELIKSLKLSPSFNTLLKLSFSTNPKDYYRKCSGVLIRINEIEKNIFWESSSLPNYRDNRDDNETKNSFNHLALSNKNIHRSFGGNIPPQVSYRNKITLWISVFMKLLDRAIITSVNLSCLLDKTSEKKNLSLECLVFFHQSILWNLRLVWFTSYFSSRAALFGKRAIHSYIYGSTSEDSVMMLSCGHPLTDLRFFGNDCVFVSKHPEQELGGGFIGIMVLGNSSVNIATASKVYGHEILVLREINKQIIQLKIRSAYERCIKSNHLQFSWLLLNDLLKNPLTHLIPSLASTVDYHGFRIMVYPLYNRTPLQLKVEGLQSTVRQEIINLKQKCNSLVSFDNGKELRLLKLENQPKSVLIFHKVFKLLLTGDVGPARTGYSTRHYRPSLVQQCSQYMKHGRDPLDSQEPHDIDSSRTSYLTSDHPFGFMAFPIERFNYFNPIKTPQNDVYPNTLFNSNENNCAPSSISVNNYLQTVVIPRAIRFLQEQPLYSPYDAITLRAWIHAYGLSPQDFGTLLSRTRHIWIKRLFLVDLVARILKTFMQDVVQLAIAGMKKFPSDTYNVEVSNIKLPLTKQQKKFVLNTLQHIYSLSSDSLQQITDLLFSSQFSPESHTTLWALVGFNLVQIIRESNFVFCFLWKSIIAVTATRLYKIDEGLIEPSNCPIASLISSFLHHTGLQWTGNMNDLILENSPISKIKLKDSTSNVSNQQVLPFPTQPSYCPLSNEIVPCVTVISCKATLQLSIFQNVLPIFTLLRNASWIPLTLSEKPQATEPVRHSSSISSKARVMPPEHSDILDSKIFAGLHKYCCASALQEFVASNVLMVFHAIDHITLLHRCRLSEMWLLPMLSPSKVEKRSKASWHSSQILHSFFPLLYGLSQCVIKTAPDEFDERRIQRKEANYTLLWALLDVAAWAMKYELWDIAESISRDSCVLFNESSLATIHGRWVMCWARLLRELTYNELAPSLPTNVQQAFHREFCHCMQILDVYWEHIHPLTADTLLAYAWIFYIMKNYQQCASLVNGALERTLYAIKNEKPHETFPLNKTLELDATSSLRVSIPSICQRNSSPCAQTKLGQFYRLLGLVYLKDAQERIRSSTQSSTCQQLKHIIQLGTKALYEAAFHLNNGYKDPLVQFLLAPSLSDLAAALLLQYKVDKTLHNDPNHLLNILSYFLTALKLRCSVLPTTHVEVIENALGVAISLENIEKMRLAFYVLQQIYVDQTSTKLLLTQALTREPNFFLTPYATNFLDIYRPCNLFSLLVWCLPSIHFYGIHEQNINFFKEVKSRSASERIYFLSPRIVTRIFLPNSNNLKERICFLYLNYEISDATLLKVFSLLHRFYKAQRTSYSYEYPCAHNSYGRDAHENLHFVDDMAFRGYPLSGRDENVIPNSLPFSHRIFIQWIRDYPRLMPRKQFISLLAFDSAQETNYPCQIFFNKIIHESEEDISSLEKTPQSQNSESKSTKTLNPLVCDLQCIPTMLNSEIDTNSSETECAVKLNESSDIDLSSIPSKNFCSFDELSQDYTSSNKILKPKAFEAEFQQDMSCAVYSTRNAGYPFRFNDASLFNENHSQDLSGNKTMIPFTIASENSFQYTKFSHSGKSSHISHQPFLMCIKPQRKSPQHGLKNFNSFASKKNVKMRRKFFQEFLKRCDPHASCPLQTQAFDILCSAFYWLLDIPSFQSRRFHRSFTSPVLHDNRSDTTFDSLTQLFKHNTYFSSAITQRSKNFYDAVFSELQHLISSSTASRQS